MTASFCVKDYRVKVSELDFNDDYATEHSRCPSLYQMLGRRAKIDNQATPGRETGKHLHLAHISANSLHLTGTAVVWLGLPDNTVCRHILLTKT